jgi:lysophosphatidic acid acyltransferase/lysophosphatidylinositol acyltransferase
MLLLVCVPFYLNSISYSLGNGRVLAKKMLTYVPTIGWAWALSDFIFLERNWDKDKDTLTNGMAELASYPSSVWLLLFAEGTRLSPEKLELSQKFAKERNLHVLKQFQFFWTKSSAFCKQQQPNRGRI